MNDQLVEPHAQVNLNHDDVVEICSRSFRFQYLTPDFQPKITAKGDLPIQAGSVIADKTATDVAVEENSTEEEPVNGHKTDELAVAKQLTAATPCSQSAEVSTETGGKIASNRRVSFGPLLSPEQFDKSLPPTTPVKRGGTPRVSRRVVGGLKGAKSSIVPVIEEVRFRRLHLPLVSSRIHRFYISYGPVGIDRIAGRKSRVAAGFE